MNPLGNEQTLQAIGPLDWVVLALNELSENSSTVLVMITAHAGSTPKDLGAWMLVSHKHTYGTLGGGQLEKMAEEEARKLLDAAADKRRSTLRCLLGPDAQQCCGGAVDLAFELLNLDSISWLRQAKESINDHESNAVLFSVNDPNAHPQLIASASKITATSGIHIQSLVDPRPLLYLFGAGHVGCSVCAIASQLPLRVVVLDTRRSRRALVPPATNVAVLDMNDPELCVSQIPDHASALVMTYSHELDYILCRSLLKKQRLLFVGLIGSRSKAARFRHRLKREGIDSQLIARLTSPIGEAGPSGKEPGIIALSALVEFMKAFEYADAQCHIETVSPMTEFCGNKVQ